MGQPMNLVAQMDGAARSPWFRQNQSHFLPPARSLTPWVLALSAWTGWGSQKPWAALLSA